MGLRARTSRKGVKETSFCPIAQITYSYEYLEEPFWKFLQLKHCLQLWHKERRYILGHHTSYRLNFHQDSGRHCAIGNS